MILPLYTAISRFSESCTHRDDRCPVDIERNNPLLHLDKQGLEGFFMPAMATNIYKYHTTCTGDSGKVSCGWRLRIHRLWMAAHCLNDRPQIAMCTALSTSQTAGQKRCVEKLIHCPLLSTRSWRQESGHPLFPVPDCLASTNILARRCRGASWLKS